MVRGGSLSFRITGSGAVPSLSCPCHSEQSEESLENLLQMLRSFFASLIRMTMADAIGRTRRSAPYGGNGVTFIVDGLSLSFPFFT